MTKLTVEKNEAVADLIERVLEAEGDEITLVVPKKSHLLDSKSNFKLLAREASVLGKTLIVESVDQDALDHAKAAGLAVIYPLFDGGRTEEELIEEAPKRARGKAVKLKVRHEEVDDSDIAAEPENEANRHGEVIKNSDDHEDYAEEERYDSLSEEHEGSRFALFATIGGILLLAILVVFSINTFFAKAEVVIHFKKTPWTFNDTVTALTSVREINASNDTVPGQLFEEEKSLTQAFPATGSANGTSKATGIITVVNNFGADPQPLVASTRFVTPDGKIYRLDSGIIVPGATVANGKVTTAGSIKAPVTADQAGAAYNTGRVDKLTLPGFKTSNPAKYAGFYGILENGAAGGGVGDRKVATDTDVANAKSKVQDIMQSAFDTTFLSSIPSDVKVLDKAAAVDLGKVLPQKSADQNGNFTMTGTAVFHAFGFREKDVVALLTAKANGDNGDKKLEDLTLNYSNAAANFQTKQLTFSLNANGNLTPDFNSDEFVGKIAGINKDQAKTIISALPDLEDAKVTIWPSWLSRLPKSSAKVHIVVE